MSFQNKTIFGFLFLLSIFFCNCQQKVSETTNSNQQAETKNDSAIRVSNAETDAAEPSIASDKDGNIFVVFVEHNPDKSADIYLQKFDKSEKPFGEKVRVNPEPKTAKAWFGDAPTIIIGDKNDIYIGWTAKVDTEKTTATTLYLSVSRDGGKTFAAPVKVNDDSAPASHGMHSLAVGDDGKIFMAWLDERNIKTEAKNFSGDEIGEPRKNVVTNGFNFVKAHHNSNQNSSNKTEETKPEKEMSHENAEPNSEVFFASSNDGGKTFSKNIKLSSEVCPCCKTNLAVDKNGKIYASWRQVVGDNFRHIAVATSENSGASFSKYTIVSDDQWQLNACPVSGSPIYSDATANPTMFWFTAGKSGKTGLYSAKSNDGGKTFQPRESVFEGTIKGTPKIFATEKNDLGIVFESAEQIFKASSDGKILSIIDGEFPSVTRNGVYAAFVREENKKRIVWLAKF